MYLLYVESIVDSISQDFATAEHCVLYFEVFIFPLGEAVDKSSENVSSLGKIMGTSIICIFG